MVLLLQTFLGLVRRCSTASLLLAVVVSAATIRVSTLTHEPFWLDEVFTDHMSAGSVTQVLERCARDTHPPLYFLGMNLAREVLGSSIAVERGYSAIWSLAGICFLSLLAKDLSGRRRALLMAGALAAVNPLDVYFAQEARMYSQVAALGCIASWILWRWFRSQGDGARLWAVSYCVIATVIPLSHYIGAAILGVQGLLAIPAFLRERRIRSAAWFVFCGGASAVALLLWIRFVISTRGHFISETHTGWIPPPELIDSFSFFWREFFWGYNGLYGPQFWKIAFLISGCVAFVVITLAVVQIGIAFCTGRSIFQYGSVVAFSRTYLLSNIFGPVALAIIFSYAINPIYYRPRFALLVLPPFLCLIAIVSLRSKSRILGTGIFICALGLMVIGVTIQQVGENKTGLASFSQFWKDRGSDNGLIVFFPEHNRRLASYYCGVEIPRLTQQILDEHRLKEKSTTLWVCSETTYNFTMPGDRERFEHLATLGMTRELGVIDGMRVLEVTVPPISRDYPPYNPGTRIEFGKESADPFLWDGWYSAERTFRWSKGQLSTVLFSIEGEQQPATLRMQLSCFHDQHITVTLNATTLASLPCGDRTPHLVEIAIPSGILTQRNTLEFGLPNATSPHAIKGTRDRRTIAIGVYWLEISKRLEN